jgi:hypothetical protein
LIIGPVNVAPVRVAKPKLGSVILPTVVKVPVPELTPVHIFNSLVAVFM